MNLNRIGRMLQIILRLQSGPVRSGAMLAEELGVSRRTVFRDLKMLQNAGVPVIYDARRGFELGRDFFLPPVSLTIPETLGLLMMIKQAAAQRGRPLAASSLSAMHKLLSSVPEPMRQACWEVMDHVTVEASASTAAPLERSAFAAIQRCIDTRRVCRFDYVSPPQNQAVRTDLEPYALHFAARAWYVIGRSQTHDEIRTFKLVRMSNLEERPRRFDRPARFQASDKIGQAWQMIPAGTVYHVELEFTKQVATNVSETLWHRTQQHRILDDGRCWMSFDVDGLDEIAWWICGYADQVRVLMPEALRLRVRDMLKRAAQLHDHPPT